MENMEHNMEHERATELVLVLVRQQERFSSPISSNRNNLQRSRASCKVLIVGVGVTKILL